MRSQSSLSKTYARALCLAAALAASGCDSSHRDDAAGTAKPILAAFNAVSDIPAATFLREEEVWSSMNFGVSTTYRSVDTGQYDVRFDVLLPGDEAAACSGDLDKDGVKDTNECTRVAEKSINVIGDREYLIVLVGRYASIDARVYDDVAHTFDTRTDDGDGADENAQVQLFNWSTALGTFDVYLAPPGTNLSATQVKATLAAGDEYNGLVDAGTYVLTLSAVGDPNAALYTSESFTLDKQTRVGFAILDATSESTSSVKVSLFRDRGGDLLDRRTKTLMRVAHVAPDAGNVDVFLEEDYTAPAFANLALRQTSAYREIDRAVVAGGVELDVTPAGNVGVLLTREQTTLTTGERATFFLVKSAAGNMDALKSSDTVRRLAPYAQLRPVNSLAASLDFYIVPHGNNVYTSTVNQTLSGASIGSFASFEPGSYDVVIARAGTDTFVFGPREVQIAGAGIYTIVAVPTAQTTVADVLLLDDFAN
jgi:hypothetical protein